MLGVWACTVCVWGKSVSRPLWYLTTCPQGVESSGTESHLQASGLLQTLLETVDFSGGRAFIFSITWHRQTDFSSVKQRKV